jgi:uncharacterized protein (DUF342 family)
MSSTSAVAPVSTTTTTDAVPTDAVLSLTERISKVEELLKDLKRAAKHLEKQVGRRRRRTPRGQKGETPQQLRAWHEEVHRVWEDMKKTDKATLYKKAVAEAARRRGGAPAASAAAAVVVAATAVTSQTPAQTSAVPTKAAKAPRAAKAAKATA